MMLFLYSGDFHSEIFHRPCWRLIRQRCQRQHQLFSSPGIIDSSLTLNDHLSGNYTELNYDAINDNRLKVSREAEGNGLTTSSNHYDHGLTFLPSVLLDISGALTCLSPDLLTPLSLASAMYLLHQRPNVLKATGNFWGDIPPCFRQYCIKSVHSDGPYWMQSTRTDMLDHPFITDGQDGSGNEVIFRACHPQSSLRAIFDVIVWLDLAFRDTSYDR